MSTMPRLAAVALTALLGVIALSASALAQPANPHAFVGTGLEPGDVVGLQEWHGDHYDQVATATADASGEWSINSADLGRDDVDENSFTLNGGAATASYTNISESLTSVALTAASSEDGMGEDGMGEDGMGEDGMGEDGMGEDGMGEDGMGEDGMGEDGMGEDGMGEDEELSLDEDGGFPGTGSGGLADSGGVSAGLIGLLIAIGAVAITGLGLRRVRNRA
ncbi:MAG: pentapeptide MXKDX repeat protein [Chloroflexi bacterium]|nr:pentapeptide MXKDX repeat protein [Chloroflexota bacterium]MCY3697189.1 pentapeptide MXKDX repeat protein [Chloroflexota bacterium]